MAISRADAAHLLRRTGFGGTFAQIDALAAQELSTVVDNLVSLNGAPPDDGPALVGIGTSTFRWFNSWRYYWYRRMITSPAPLQEKMTLFWHHHFTSQVSKVRPDLMSHQNALLRAHALGNFRTLAKAVSVQPAMLIYLDNYTNRVGHAQENFARELWELFTLGLDQYTQDDIVACARTWTGHTIDAPYDEYYLGPVRYVFKPEWHDNGAKTIFGVTRNWNGPDVIDFTLDGPKRAIAARFLVTRLWSFFAHPNPDASIVNALAEVLLASNWEMRPLMRAMLLHPAFYSETAKSNLLRTPVEYIVAAIRYAGMNVGPDTLAPVEDVAVTEPHDNLMGMQLGEPPDVSGWKQNNYWISSSTFFARAEFARELARTAVFKLGLFRNFTDGSLTPAQMADAALAQFGIDSPTATTRQGLVDYLTRDNNPQTRSDLGFNAMRIVLMCPDFALA